MTALIKGWWRDERRNGVAHFYDEADRLDSEILMVWPKCGIENSDRGPNADPRDYLALPDAENDEARPFVDMSDCVATACPECVKALNGGSK